MRRWAACLAAAVALVYPMAVSNAQTTGRIEGTVRDAAGSPLPGVTVEATSTSLQGTRIAVTNKEGRYHLPALPPGPYRVRATLESFRPSEEVTVVSLDATATVDFTLQVAARESVVVSGEAPMIDVASTTTGTNYVSEVINRLPVARNYADIVRANPGVLPDQGQTQGRSLALSIYGSTSVEHLWIIDGVNTTNVLKGMQGKAINNEFVEEVEVKTGGYQAEYGRALGGVINVITKSGGNQFHGDSFLYYDSAAVQATRVFKEGEDSTLTGMRLADYRRWDYGADLGGFIIKDRLWFFAAYDRIDFQAKLSRYDSTPLVPSTMTFPLDGTDNLYSGKLTWNLSRGSTLVASVFADPTTNSGAGLADPRQAISPSGTLGVYQPITNPDPGTWESSRSIGGTDYGLRLNQLFGTASLFTLQASRHQDRYDLLPTGAGSRPRLEDFTCAGGTPEHPCVIPGAPNVVTGGLGFILGANNRSTSHRDQIRGDGTGYLASHEIKLGGDYQEGKTSALTYFSGGQLVQRYNDYGQIYYSHRFFTTSLTDLSPTDSNSGSKVRDFGVFLQDSWRPTPGLTVNAGLRLDRELVYNYLDEAVIRTSTWQPRLGVVWDPKRDGKTKLYAFAGRFSYGLPTDFAVRSFGGNNSAVTYNFDPAALDQNPNVFKHEKARVSGGSFGDPVDRNLKGISQDELTVGMERLLGSSLTIGLKGTYRRLANAIEDRCDLDYNRPETNYSGCGLVNPGSNGAIASGNIPGWTGLDPPFQEFTDTIPATPPARRLYRGIELTARKTIGTRLWLQASYVYSSLRGNYDGEVSETYGQTDPGINQDFDYPAIYHNSYGRLYLDRPHQLRLDGFYVTPFRLSIGLQAWLRSGAPLSRLGYLQNYFVPWSPIQLDPKGYTGRLPMEWDANLVLAFPIEVGPVTVTPQAYVYNLFNNQIRTSQDMVWSNQEQIGYPDSIFDPSQKQTNPNYGRVTGRQDPRLFRAAVKVSF
jgi:carboxypeptidase family protein/TonB-dependent receptor-like protein